MSKGKKIYKCSPTFILCRLGNSFGIPPFAVISNYDLTEKQKEPQITKENNKNIRRNRKNNLFVPFLAALQYR